MAGEMMLANIPVSCTIREERSSIFQSPIFQSPIFSASSAVSAVR
jgi:hypothetical protein